MTMTPTTDAVQRGATVVVPLRRARHARRLTTPSVTVVLPVLDEAAGLAATLPLIPDYVTEIIVVDGGSTDASVVVVHEILPDAVVLTQAGRGKGDALKTGIAMAGGDIIVTMDADGSMDPRDIDAAIELLLQGDHFVKGSRCLPGGGSDDFTPVRRAGNAFLTSATNAMVGRRFTDITYGFNAYWREVSPLVEDLADGFEFEIQLAVRATRSGLRTAEVPCHEATRVGGATKLHAFKDGWRILKAIVTEAQSGPRHHWHMPDRLISPGPTDSDLLVDRDAVR